MSDAERDEWVQADRILDRLLDLPRQSRRARLAGMDLDCALRDRAERLLAAMEDEDGPLDHPLPLLPAL